jgi:hypothetical protein
MRMSRKSLFAAQTSNLSRLERPQQLDLMSGDISATSSRDRAAAGHLERAGLRSQNR